MWRITIDRGAAAFWVVFLVLFLALMAALYPADAHMVYVKVYLACFACVFCTVLILMLYRRNFGFDVLDPIWFITLIYGGMFFVTPIYDIVRKHYYWFGYDLFGTGFRATFYAMVGYVAFVAAYAFFSFRREAPALRELQPEREEAGRRNVPLIIAMFVFCFAANMYYLTRNGSSWLYVLSLGVFDAGTDTGRAVTDIGFLAMFSYCLPAVVLLYWEYGENRFLKGLFFALMLVMQVARGFRFFVVQIFVTFMAYVFLRRGKRPSFGTLFGVAAVAILPLLLMTLFRNTLRLGGAVDYGAVSAADLHDAIDEAFWFNFQIYHNFYGLIAKVPSRYPFVYGRQILIGTVIMLIPRILWPGKLPSAAGEELSVLIGSHLKGTGQALPNLGEFYYALGLPGILLCMALYGLWMRHVKQRYLIGTRRPTDWIQFSVLLGANLQIIIRGYTPSNFWYVVFSLLPVWLFTFAVRSSDETHRRRVRAWESGAM